MNKNIAALSLASLLLIGPACTLAAEETNAGSAAPPTALPGVNSGSKQSNEEKANKKGEESSGGNAGAQSHETEKDAATSSDSDDIKKKHAQ